MLMKAISLLPSEYKKLKKSARRRELLVAALGILTVVMVFSYLIVKILSSIPGDKLRMLKTENENLLRSIQALDYLNEREESIQMEADLAQKAVGNQPDWLTLFTSISFTVPDEIQLSSITAAPQEEPLSFIFQGNAKSNTVLAEWMDQLKELQLFTGMELSYAKAAGESGTTVDFEMKAIVKDLEPFKLFEEAVE